MLNAAINHNESQYLALLSRLLDQGIEKNDRTGTGTYSLFGYQMHFNLQQGFPLLTTKKLHLRSIIHELLWFLKGETNIAYLKENGVSIWDEWADEQGDLGPIYGHQWRSWTGADGQTVDQIKTLLEQLKSNPDSRRLIVSAWNPGDLPDMALPPCHCLFQFYTRPLSIREREAWLIKNRGIHLKDQGSAHNELDLKGAPRRALSCQLYQRSGDVFLGVPFNIASYAILTTMIAQVVGMVPEYFVHTLGDAHLYKNHVDQAKEQLARSPLNPPRLTLNASKDSLFSFGFEDIQVSQYEAHPAIKAPVAV